MKRPILFALFFLIAGIILRVSFDSMFLYALGLALGLIFCIFIFINKKYLPILIAFLFMPIGMIRAGGSLEDYITEPVQVSIIGVVQDVGRTRGGNNWSIVRIQNPNIQVMAYTRDYHVLPRVGYTI